MQFFSAHFRFVRHDERGCGMSEWNDQHLTVERWTDDLESIIDAGQRGDCRAAVDQLKTVRNHASNLFDKLGVWSRDQAIVFARDRGYNG